MHEMHEIVVTFGHLRQPLDLPAPCNADRESADMSTIDLGELVDNLRELVREDMVRSLVAEQVQLTAEACPWRLE